MDTKRKRITFGLILLVLFISIGYAVLTTVFNVNSSVSLSKVSFNIHFDNVVISEGNKAEVAEGNDARITNDAKTEITFAVSLKKLGDYYSFTTDIINEGTIPGKVKSIDLNGLSDSQKKLLKYDVYYTESGRNIKPGDYVGPELSKNITFDLVYELDADISNEDMPTDDVTVQCTLVITMENGTLNEYRSRAASNRLMQDEDYFPTSFLTFTRPANSNEHQGIYRLDGTENDDYPIYFYRGLNSNIHNHVKFAGYCWRIVRTTNTGGIKIIYNGIPNENGICSNSSSTLGRRSYAFDSNGSWKWDEHSIKEYMSTWYFENIISYQSFLEDTVFCNDNQYTNGRITLDCSSENEVSVANGKNNYPIGFLTAEEANMCGMSADGTNGDVWISGGNYWTMTGYLNEDNNRAWVVSNTLFASYYYTPNYYRGVWDDSYSVRPVLSFNSDVSFTEGDGTANNPYIASLS